MHNGCSSRYIQEILNFFVHIILYFYVYIQKCVYFGNALLDLIQDILNAPIEFDGKCENEFCRSETEATERQVKEINSQYQEAKREYTAALIENLKKDYIIEKLTQQ